MSKFPHETKGFNEEFHGWYNIEPPPIPRSPNANPTFNYETGIAEYWNHKLMKAEKELVDLNDEANEAFYRASKQKTKKRRGHIESYKRSREGKVEIEEA
ncbi:hypothetical protein DVH24_019712 [Malus domestica]|uniref:Uncharacterized protein n=1 Tax=Malus domestica TaxID=3750 RepID=A0A498I3R7_MALDO|nr:hypothetical protein DVH24_019712 [Malus domestica]